MKEALGGIPLFEIVIVFILVFTGIMCLTINHAKAFGVKDEIINIIETSELTNGLNINSLDQDVITQIIDKLTEVGYRNNGDCPDSSWKGYRRDGHVTNNHDAAFCVRANNVSTIYYQDLVDKCRKSGCTTFNGGFPPMVYYEIALFYQLDIPLASSINFRIYGSTKTLFG